MRPGRRALQLSVEESQGFVTCRGDRCFTGAVTVMASRWEVLWIAWGAQETTRVPVNEGWRQEVRDMTREAEAGDTTAGRGCEPRVVGGPQKLKRAGSRRSLGASGRDRAPQHLAVSPGSLCRLLTSEAVRRQVRCGGMRGFSL